MLQTRCYLFMLLLVAPACLAQFQLQGNVKLTHANDNQQTLTYGFSYYRQEGQYHFSAGTQSLKVAALPKKYTLSLVLNNNERNVWVPDFSTQPLTAFTLTIADHHIELLQEAESTARGKFILLVDNERYKFSSGPAQIDFLFNEQGITGVEVRNVARP